MMTDECDLYWAKLLGQAIVAVPGASDALLKVQLFDTLEEFFDGSGCWSEGIKFDVVPDLFEYELFPQSGRISRLDRVFDQNGVPQQALMPTPGTVQFLFPYSNPQPMTAVVLKTVTDPLRCFPPHIPEWMLPMHGLKILHGLIGGMMLQAGQSYSNPQLANFHLAKFNDGISGAYVSASKANTVGVQPWAYPQQFRVSGQRGGVSTSVLPAPR